jgi:hypothetical protein
MSNNGSKVVVADEGDDTNVVELDSEVARRAFESGDVAASRQFHESKTIAKENDEKHTEHVPKFPLFFCPRFFFDVFLTNFFSSIF